MPVTTTTEKQELIKGAILCGIQELQISDRTKCIRNDTLNAFDKLPYDDDTKEQIKFLVNVAFMQGYDCGITDTKFSKEELAQSHWCNQNNK